MTTPNLLGTIVAATRHAVAARQVRIPLPVLEKRITRTPRGDRFATALRSSPAPRIIAECKRRSPSKGILRESYEPASHARAYAHAGAAAISILTEPAFFDGSPDHLAQARSAVDTPLLRKDFIVSSYQLIETAAIGADAALFIIGALHGGKLEDLIAQARSLGLAALVEVHSREELSRALDGGADIIGVNSRNLETLTVDAAVLDELIGLVPPHVTAVAESGIKTAEDVARLTRGGYHAFLVGERLITQPDPGAALSELRRQCAPV